MAKQSGLGDNFYLDAFNVSGDISSLGSISCPMGALEVTGIDKFATERIYGHQDGHMEATTFFNDATGQEHDALKTLPRTDRVFSYFHGSTLGNAAASMVCKQIGYDGTRADDGALTYEFVGEANSFGLDWGRMVTPGVRTDGSATNGTSVDFGTGSTAFGLQMYVHLFAFTGTSVTITLQESSDNGAGDAFAAVTGASTGALTTPQAMRLQTSRTQTVERYLRVVTTGTFSNAVFAVSINRNETLVNY